MSLDPFPYDLEEPSVLGRVPIRNARLINRASYYGAASSYGGAIIFIFISALIFIAVISTFDVVRLLINNYYTKRTLKSSDSKKEDVRRIILSNESNLRSSVVFAFVTILLALVLIPILVRMMRKE